MKKVIWLSGVLAVLPIATQNAAHADPALDSLIRKAVVHFKKSNSGCSGTAITPRFVLTAGHCHKENQNTLIASFVTENGTEKEITLKPRLSIEIDGTTSEANVLRTDFAIYEAVDGSFPNFIPLSEENPDRFSGGPFLAVGFPAFNQQRYTTSTVSSLAYENGNDFGRRVSESPNIPERIATYSRNGSLVSFGGKIGPGNSGGPLFDLSSEVGKAPPELIGIVVGGSMNETHGQNGRATPGSQIMKVTAQLNPALARDLGWFRFTAPETGDKKLFYPNSTVKIISDELHLNGTDLTGIQFEELSATSDCTFENVKFISNTIYAGDLKRCRFRNTIFKNVVYSVRTRFPKSAVIDPARNIGPLPETAQRPGDLPPRTIYQSGIYTGVGLSTRFDLKALTFTNCTFVQDDLQNLRETATSETSEARELAFKTAFQDKYIEFSAGVSPCLGLTEPYQSACESVSGAKAWTNEEETSVRNAIYDWIVRFPKLFGNLGTEKVRFSRIRSFPVFLKSAPWVQSGLENGLTPRTPLFAKKGDSDAEPVITITFTDQVFNSKDYRLNGVSRALLTVFHELIHVAQFQLSSSAIPKYAAEDLLPPIQGNNQTGFKRKLPEVAKDPRDSRMNLSIEKAWDLYLEMKRKDESQAAMRFSYKFAKRYGYPSIYSIWSLRPMNSTTNQFAEPEETYADMLAYAALDPDFERYAKPEAVKAARLILR